MNRLNVIGGRPVERYGLANLEALTPKRQRVLPTECRVYDLLNFASELATHHARPQARQALQGYLGTVVSGEYDLEDSANEMKEFGDFFATAPATLN